jgi:hypothetical protein
LVFGIAYLVLAFVIDLIICVYLRASAVPKPKSNIKSQESKRQIKAQKGAGCRRIGHLALI